MICVVLFAWHKREWEFVDYKEAQSYSLQQFWRIWDYGMAWLCGGKERVFQWEAMWM